MFNFLTSNYGDFRSDNFAIPRCLLLHCARAAAWCWLVLAGAQCNVTARN